MSLFFTVVIMDSDDGPTCEVHGPFDNESARETAIEELADVYENYYICRLNAECVDDEVSLIAMDGDW